MQQPKEKLIVGEAGFWQTWMSKLLFTLISVKLWGLIASISISTWLLLSGDVVEIGDKTFSRITGEQWVTFNTTVWALIFGMKEVFRISEKRDRTEQQNLNQQLDNKQKVATILSSASAKSPSAVQSNTDGTETVGSEPD